MKEVVLEIPCIAKELKIKEIPNPKVKPDWVLIKSKAFGIHRSQIIVRNSFSQMSNYPESLI